MIAPRARTRPVPPPAPTISTPYGYPVIGGPRPPETLANGAVFPTGTYHCLAGKPIKVWPWRTGADVIGLIYHEYEAAKGGGFNFLATHVYELHEKTWRYIGKVASWDAARARLDDQYEKRQAIAVQPVAPRARTRPSV
jgi:hypothetical protein